MSLECKPHFSKEYRDDLRARLGSGLVGIIGETLDLKKRGSLYKACCPFHDESTPSFTVQDGESGWHWTCYGACNTSGDVFKYLMMRCGLSFHEAVARVAEEVGVDLPAVTQKQKEAYDRNRRLRTIADLTARFFTHHLHAEVGAEALAYLKGRGIGERQMDDFQLGYAPRDRAVWRRMIDFLLTRRKFTDEEMLASGVFRRDDRSGELKPFFSHKVIFPIRDIDGYVVAFSGRRLGDGDGPKYINTGKCELFPEKGRIVYNANRAVLQVKETKRRILGVEGYTDVIAVEAADLGPVVCFMGTAATEHHMETLWKMTGKDGPDPVLCFDGDRAGQAAAAAAAARFLPLLGPGRTVRFALLQGAHDPASLLDQEGGRNVLNSAIENAQAAPMVLYHQELAAMPRTPSPEDVAAFDARVRDRILNEIRDKSLQGAYRDEFWRLKRQRSNPRAVVLPTGAPATVSSSCREAALLAAVLLNPTLFNEFGEDMAGWEMPTPALETLRGRIVDALSLAGDDDGLVRAAGAFVEDNADAVSPVLSDAVFAAAPFSRPGTSLDAVVAGMRRVLVDMQVSATKREVARLTALLQSPEGGGEVQDILRRLPPLLEQLREQSSI